MKRAKSRVEEEKVGQYHHILCDMILSGEIKVTVPNKSIRTMTECKQTKLQAIWKRHLDLLGCKRLVGIHFRRVSPSNNNKKESGDWILGFQVQKSGIVWLYGNEEGSQPGHVFYLPVTLDRQDQVLPPLEGDSKHIRHMDPLPRDIRWAVPYTQLKDFIVPTRVDTLGLLKTGAVLITMTSGQQMIWSANAQQTMPPILRWGRNNQ